MLTENRLVRFRHVSYRLYCCGICLPYCIYRQRPAGYADLVTSTDRDRCNINIVATYISNSQCPSAWWKAYTIANRNSDSVQIFPYMLYNSRGCDQISLMIHFPFTLTNVGSSISAPSSTPDTSRPHSRGSSVPSHASCRASCQ